MKRAPTRLMLGVVLSAVALAAVLLTVDLAALRAALAVTPLPALGLAGLWFGLAMLTRAWAWRALLGPQVSFGRAFWALQIGFLVNNLVPLRLGELARAWVVHREAAVPWSRALSSIALARLTDGALLALVVVLLWPAHAVLPRAWVWRAVALALAVLVLVGGLAWATRGLRARLPARLRDALVEAAAVAQGPALARFALGKALTWALLAAYYHALVRVWAPDLGWGATVWAMAASTLGIAAPSAPGYIGVYEAAAVGVLAVLQVPQADALAFALVQHGLYLLLTTLLGVLALARLGWGRARWRAEWATAQSTASSSRRNRP